MADQLFPSRMQIYDENGRSLLRPRRPQVRHSGAVQIRWWSDEYSQPRKKEEYPWIPRGMALHVISGPPLQKNMQSE